MRGTLLVVIALAASGFGCDQIFRLEAPPIDSGALVCAYANLAADDDEDHDGVLNANDLCPTVPAHAAHDEDGDGAPDPCDPCPEVALAGSDPECDAVGAACDPDEAIEHEQTFYGFGSDLGVRLYAEGTIAADSFHFTQGVENYGQVRVTQPSESTGVYELHAIVSGIDAGYWELGLFARDVAASLDYQLKITVFNHTVTLEINQFQGPTLTKVASVGSLGTTAELTLRTTIEGADVHLELIGDARGTASATIPSLPAAPLRPGSIIWGVNAYRDPPASSAFRVEVPYVRRLAPKT